MKTVFLKAPFLPEIKLNDEILSEFEKKQVKKLAVFASVQFLALDTVRKQLSEKGIEVLTTKAKRTSSEGQILGCDAYHDSFEEDVIDNSDAILYVGDGMFHPKALLLAQVYKSEKKDVYIWDPVAEKVELLPYTSIGAQVKKTIVNLKLFIACHTVGILVTSKPGQQYYKNAVRLKEKLENEGKKAFLFVDDTVNIALLENYPFVDVWVNTACPRIGTDDIVHAPRPLINIVEAFDPVKALERIL